MSELRIHYGTGYRVYFCQQGDTVVILLCGGNKSTQSRGERKMTEIFSEFDPAEYLTSPETIAEFVTDALENGGCRLNRQSYGRRSAGQRYDRVGQRNRTFS